VSRGVIPVRPAWLEELDEDLPIHVIGDAASGTSADEAIRQGAAVARQLAPGLRRRTAAGSGD
jgi:hypothetical protein